MNADLDFYLWTYNSTLFLVIAAVVVLLGGLTQHVFGAMLREGGRNPLGWMVLGGVGLLCALCVAWNVAPKFGFRGFVVREFVMLYVAAYILGTLLYRGRK